MNELYVFINVSVKKITFITECVVCVFIAKGNENSKDKNKNV